VVKGCIVVSSKQNGDLTMKTYAYTVEFLNGEEVVDSEKDFFVSFSDSMRGAIDELTKAMEEKMPYYAQKANTVRVTEFVLKQGA
jgi:hypothetical protein